jgi:hypothetical protein
MPDNKPPRDHANYKDRGPKQFAYTYQDIAKAVGLKVRSVQNARSRGEFDPENLASVAAYINGRIHPRLAEALGPELTEELADVIRPTTVLAVPGLVEPEICDGVVCMSNGMYRCEECAWQSNRPPKRAAHHRIEHAPARCGHESSDWYQTADHLGCRACDTAQELLDDGLVCMTCKEPSCDCQLDLFQND